MFDAMTRGGPTMWPLLIIGLCFLGVVAWKLLRPKRNLAPLLIAGPTVTVLIGLAGTALFTAEALTETSAFVAKHAGEQIAIPVTDTNAQRPESAETGPQLIDVGEIWPPPTADILFNSMAASLYPTRLALLLAAVQALLAGVALYVAKPKSARASVCPSP